MPTFPQSKHRSYEYVLAVFAALIVIIYIYGKLLAVPYLGFDVNPTTGSIIRVENETTSSTLHPDDRILIADGIRWENYHEDMRQPILVEYSPGQTIPIFIERNEQEMWVEWTLPAFNVSKVLYRATILWPALAFWIAGTASLFLLRPKDKRYRLLVAFNYLTALWLIAGSLSSTHLWNSVQILHAGVWLCIPVYWRLHWVFPKPLQELPERTEKRMWGALYLFAAIMAIADWFDLLPRGFYIYGFLLAAASVLLLAVHAIYWPEQRRDLNLLLLAVLLIALPAVALGVTMLLGYTPDYGGGALISLPALPAAYFYAVYRRQLGGLELRANRAISVIVYLTLLFSISFPIITILRNWFTTPYAVIGIGVGSGLLSSLITLLFYPNFQHWIERHFLGIPLPPTGLLEAYTAQIITSLELDRLVHLIRDEVFPSLLIRQAAVLRIEGADPQSMESAPIITLGLEPAQIPDADEIAILIAQAGHNRTWEDDQAACPWVRLALKLMVNEELVGICLLGRRDPDDEYAISEIPTLQALMDQAALAIINIEQAERLRILSQIHIERQETEHRHLALELHDDFLGQMAMLRMNISNDQINQPFIYAYQTAVQRMREIVNGLYPGMLNYGLPAALEELSDSLLAQVEDRIKINMEISSADMRYPPNVELHLYRIIQQACQNTIQHAQAQHLHIQGRLEPKTIYLEIRDDGIGFETNGRFNLSRLLTQKHYGLAGIFERAAFIGARVDILSQPGRGTHLIIAWKADSPSDAD